MDVARWSVACGGCRWPVVVVYSIVTGSPLGNQFVFGCCDNHLREIKTFFLCSSFSRPPPPPLLELTFPSCPANRSLGPCSTNWNIIYLSRQIVKVCNVIYSEGTISPWFGFTFRSGLNLGRLLRHRHSFGTITHDEGVEKVSSGESVSPFDCGSSGVVVVLVEILCPYPNYNYQLKTVLWGGTPNTDKVIKISFIFIARRHTRTAWRWMAVVPQQSAQHVFVWPFISVTSVAKPFSGQQCQLSVSVCDSTVGNGREAEYIICRTILDEPPSPPSWVIQETSQGKTN